MCSFNRLTVLVFSIEIIFRTIADRHAVVISHHILTDCQRFFHAICCVIVIIAAIVPRYTGNRKIMCFFFTDSLIQLVCLTIDSFQLRDVHRVGVLRARGYIGNLAALDNSVPCLIDCVRAYTDCPFGCFPCRFKFLLRRQIFYEVRMFSFPIIKSLFRFSFFIFRSIVKRLR